MFSRDAAVPLLLVANALVLYGLGLGFEYLAPPGELGAVAFRVLLAAPAVVVLALLPVVPVLQASTSLLFRSVRRTILWVALLLILGVPIVFFAVKQWAGIADPSELYRREWITMVSLDIAISQHFYLIAGYTLTAVALALVGGAVKGDALSYLLAFTTLTAIDSSTPATLLSLVMGVYGFVGIALLVSLSISTYTRVIESFSQSSQELEEFLATILPLDADEIDWAEMDQERRNALMRVLAGEMLQHAIDRGDFGDPTLTRVWRGLRLAR